MVWHRRRQSSLSLIVLVTTLALGVASGGSVASATPSALAVVASPTLRSPLVESSTRTSMEATVAPRAKKAAYVVTTRKIGGLGKILVDGKGQTLYVFYRDHHSGHSKCTSECAAEWPPLLLPAGVTKPVAAGSAKASLLATTRRTDGTLQVTYKGWPLYRFALDSGPGDASGEDLNNLGGLWYVLQPSGAVRR